MINIDMLPVKHNANLFYRIDVLKLQSLDKEEKEIVAHINSTWTDIEYLNYLFHKNFGNISDDPEFAMTFSALLVLSDSFYVHMSTLYLLLKKLGDRDKNVKKLLSLNKKFFDRIQIVRNHIIVHKEKQFYKKQLGNMSDTDPVHLIERMLLVIEDDGKQRVYTLKPLMDIYKISKLLENAGRLLISEKAQ